MMILSIFVVRIISRTKTDRIMRNVLLILLFSFLSLSTVNAGEETYYPAVTNSKGWNIPGTRSNVGSSQTNSSNTVTTSWTITIKKKEFDDQLGYKIPIYFYDPIVDSKNVSS